MGPPSLLRLSAVAWSLVGLFVLAQATFVLISAPHTLTDGPGVIALAAAATAAVVLALHLERAPSPFATAVVLASVLVMTVSVESTLEPRALPYSYEAWHFGACSVILLTLLIRGRAVSAWGGMVLLIAVTAVWLARGGASPWSVIELMIWDLAMLAVGTVVTIGLASLRYRLHRLRTAASGRASAEECTATAQAERRRRTERILHRVEPVLETIASPRSLRPADRSRARLLEAALRDEIRAPDLIRQPIFVTALESVRRTGSDVLLLDDADESAEALHQRDVLTRRLAPTLATLTDPRITVRFSGSDGSYRLSLVSESRSATVLSEDAPSSE